MNDPILEAAKKRPSGLGKIRDKSVNVEVEMIAGDIYDLSDSNRYTETMKYYKGDGDGYITDKEGHIYDVVTSSEQGDAGRIAGGSHDYYVTIKNVAGKDLRFHGYSAVFSRSSYTNIIEDIKAGMYLEDYLAKNWGALNYDTQKDGNIIDLKEKGNAEAKTYDTEKKESEAERTRKFWERYVIIRDIKVSIKGSQVELDNNDIENHYKKKVADPKFSNMNRWDDGYEEYQAAYEKYESMVKAALKPIIADIFSKKFGCSMSDMSGLIFNLVAKGNTATTMARLGFDTKKKQFVQISWDKAKLKGEKEWVNEHITLDLGPTITLDKNYANERMKEIFMNASKEWMKLNKGQQKAWVDKHWYAIYQEGNRYSWDRMLASKAKAVAAENYKKYLAQHAWDTSGSNITFMTEFISQFMTSPEKIEQPTGVEIENSPARRGENTVLGKGARAKQEPKMDAWHNGTRKQNVSSCSDAKLKLNYEICKDKGYNKEAAILKAEAEKRGLVIESIHINLTDYIKICLD